MKKGTDNRIAVDMVPLIDVISLLLMFLIIVGNGAAEATSIEMKLPRADQAKRDDKMKSEGRIVVQMTARNGEYYAVIDNHAFSLTHSSFHQTLPDYLSFRNNWSVTHGYAVKEPNGALSTPVKLRIPEAAPMKDVETLVMTLASVGLVNIQYAADGAATR